MVITLAFHAGNRGSSPLFGKIILLLPTFALCSSIRSRENWPITILVNKSKTEITADMDFQLTSFPAPRTIFVFVCTGESESWCKFVPSFDGIEVGSFSLLVLPNPDLSVQ